MGAYRLVERTAQGGTHEYPRTFGDATAAKAAARALFEVPEWRRPVAVDVVFTLPRAVVATITAQSIDNEARAADLARRAAGQML